MKRIYGVIDKRLSEAPHLAGEYSIADKATYPWPRPHNWPGQKLEDFPHLKKWYDAIEARPAVQRGCAVMKEQLEKQRSVARTPSRGKYYSASSNSKSDSYFEAAARDASSILSSALTVCVAGTLMP